MPKAIFFTYTFPLLAASKSSRISSEGGAVRSETTTIKIEEIMKAGKSS